MGNKQRTEKDFLGQIELPAAALYGINAWRATQNFPDQTPFHKEWYQAMGLVKLACYRTVIAFKNAASGKYPDIELPKALEIDWEPLCEAAAEISAGKYFEHFIVPAIQGGAGTSINMNVNEILANASLQKLGHNPGTYEVIDPFDHANIFQSTNDVVPTALKLAIMQLLLKLEEGINHLRSGIEGHESNNRNNLRIAYTQMQEAVPSSFGMLFSAWNDALSRDWWRVSKCFERIKVVNLGGGATGTGMAIPRFFIMEVVPQLQKLTSLPITRSENHADTTQNLDVFVEVHAILKSHAVNLEKIASDIRLLSSDVSCQKDISIPQKQTGSSIMPGKVNPVISEFVISAAHKVYSNDMLISGLCAQGSLDLNPYLPTIGHALLESLKLLIAAGETFRKNLVDGMQVESGQAREKLFHSPSITTALVPYVGYHKAGELAMLMREKGLSIHEANKELGLLDAKKLEEILKPENMLKLGYSLSDL
jgi:aspartate ammonia-lyase